MVSKIAIVHTDFRLYWPARLLALSDYLMYLGIKLSVIEISGKGSPYSFAKTEKKENIEWHCLFQDMQMENISSTDAVRQVLQKLDKIQPDVILAGAIAFPSGAASVRWAVKNRRPIVIFDDARLQDVPRGALVNYVKRAIYRNVNAMFIPAPSHSDTYRYFGLSSEQLFFGVNCIDNDFFAKELTGDECFVPDEIMKKPYFLAVGRQIEKKNWIVLLRAFKRIVDHPSLKSWALVFIGDGPEHNKLVEEAALLNNDRIYFLPFKNQSELRSFYRNASALVLPSLFGETWGLVVNEAMASGLPVLASSKCGCAATLVYDGHNGFVFDPENERMIAGVLQNFASLDNEKRSAMSSASLAMISSWNLDCFCNGVWSAISYTMNSKCRRNSIAGRVIINFWKGRYRPT
jgi:glycosyltransferase involved in cell wall biosynthesis